MTTFALQPSAPASAPNAPSTSAGDGASPATGPGASPLGSLSTLLFPLLLMVFFIWMTRSQTKKQKELESTLKSGDRVVTRAGMIGKVTKVADTTLELELAPGVHVTFLKSAIEGLHTAGVKPADSKATDAKGTEAKKSEPKKSESSTTDKSKTDKDAKDKA